MTYVANTPLSTDSPGILPAQVATNFGRLQTIIGADHQFNNGALPNDGWHNLIHMTEQVPVPAIAATGQLYVKSASGVTQLFYTDSAGTEHQITPESAVSSTLVIGQGFVGIGASVNMFANPAYNYSGNASVFIQGTAEAYSANLAKSGTTGQTYGFTNTLVTTGAGFLLFYDVNGDLYLNNSTGAIQLVSFVVTVNKATP